MTAALWVVQHWQNECWVTWQKVYVSRDSAMNDAYAWAEAQKHYPGAVAFRCRVLKLEVPCEVVAEFTAGGGSCVSEPAAQPACQEGLT